jgi:hypothetical protein
MVHLQALRNLDVFLRKTGIKQFTPEDAMSFCFPTYRLDLVFCNGMLHMTLSTMVEHTSDEAYLNLMARAGTPPSGPLLRIYRTAEEIGANGVLSDSDSAESWFRMYALQKTLILDFIKQNQCTS